ncbi:MAG: hypothetical protein HUU50_19315 [Candidatus Brocadiae bacterium]|nr:hypothetical protein [Candidatus Brocadiia bacterium]
MSNELKPEKKMVEKTNIQEDQPFAILEDFTEDIEQKPLSITERIKRELFEKEQQNPDLNRVKKLAKEAQIGLTDKIRQKIEESLDDGQADVSSDKYVQKTREQLRAMSEQAKTGLTAKIKKIVAYQRNLTLSKANQEWERLKKMAREAQISVTAKIQAGFLSSKPPDIGEKGESSKPEPLLSCLILVIGVFFLGILVAFFIEKLLGA